MDTKAIAANVADKQISGALFDFMGRLTTLDEPLSVGGSEECSPILDIAKQWADERGLSFDEADVENWNVRLSSADRKQIARELLEIARLLDGAFVSPDSNAGSNAVLQQYQRIKGIRDLGQRAQLTNLVSEVAYRNQDRSGLTQRPGFRGWGRQDFVNLSKMFHQGS